jgi:predicted PurR-regulated permease PerM
MTSVSEVKNKLHGAWRSMGEQDFISQPWVIALLVIMAVAFILILAPAVIQKLPDTWSGITTNQEAIRNQLALAAEFIPGLKNRLGGSLTRMQQMSSSVSNPSVGAIIFLLVTLCLTLISFYKPDLFPRDITPIQ